MAKHRRSRSPESRRSFDINTQTRRDDFSISSDLSDPVFERVSRSLPVSTIDFVENYSNAVRSTLSDVEDRRTYYPAGRNFRPASSPRRHLVKIKSVSHAIMHPLRVMAFEAPRAVAICIRRKMRREVLHALQKSGKGSRHNRKPRYNENSKVRC